MLAVALFAALAPTAYSLAIPQSQTTGGVYPPFPANISVTYYQGSTGSTNCMMPIGTGALHAEVCTPLYWSGIGIAQSLANTCSFTLFTGSTSCSGANGTAESTAFSIAAGNGTVCVGVGVLDGGKFQKASGVWSCA
ncbi:hypothetical protein LTR08_007291 [Meristemomyces frigidus]|nr:hypothetical protein LTR08_007291 [Meristemomyces frigidus]